MGVVLHFDEIALRLQVSHNGFPGLVPVHAFVLTAQGIDLALVVQHPDDLQVMPQAHLEVVGIMGRRHLHAAGAEFHFGIVIGHHRDGLIQQGQDHILAHNGSVSIVVGVDADTGVTQHGFRPGSRHHNLSGAVLQRVTDMPQMAGLIHILNLRVTQRGNTVGAPIDDPAALVDKALLIQGDKHLPDGLGAAFVHGKASPVPVAAGTQFLLLLYDPVTEPVFPVPHPLQELFPAQIVPSQPLFAQLFLHLDLGSNAGVVHAWDPQGVVALHPLEADDAVL